MVIEEASEVNSTIIIVFFKLIKSYFVALPYPFFFTISPNFAKIRKKHTPVCGLLENKWLQLILAKIVRHPHSSKSR